MISALLLLLGALLIFIGALGVVKFPDALMRAHALSKALTLGIALMLLGLIPFLQSYAEGIKIFLAILFLFATIPIAGHIFALYAKNH
ncbi:MAG: monovalent cation/H(+) antiporter subunit G [Chlamydiia bacterium]|nr:monovalent cation/H(+) antiporter subunit G [Chlamydiia bacterium]